jgi:5'-3' exonuclease
MIQAVQEFGVKLFHPIKDKYVQAPTTYDYCVYKAIKGDKADEIEGIYGYGEKKAARLAEELYSEDFIDDISCPELSKDQQKQVLRNLRLIRISNNPNLKNAKVDIDEIISCSNVDLPKIQKFYFDNKLKSLVEGFESVVSIFS